MGIGDELMAAGAARRHFERTGRAVRIQRPVGRRGWFEIWDGLPYIKRPDEGGSCDVVWAKDQAGLRPYIVEKSRERWIWRAYGPAPAEIRFRHDEIAHAAPAKGCIVVEPNLKPGASPNKNWGWERWQALLRLRPDLRWLQLGPEGTPRLKGAGFLATPSFRHAAAALAAARAAVLTEGGLHHAAAATGTPAVVIFGGFIAPAVTGYDGQHSIFVRDRNYPLGCGYRVPCPHCDKAMQEITPARVIAELEALLEKLQGTLAA